MEMAKVSGPGIVVFVRRFREGERDFICVDISLGVVASFCCGSEEASPVR